jgi:hypothetical protein
MLIGEEEELRILAFSKFVPNIIVTPAAQWIFLYPGLPIEITCTR